MCNKNACLYVIITMRTILFRSLVSFVFLSLALAVFAQERKVQNRPYIDERRLHYGFLFGVHMQDIELQNNGFIDPASGEQWYAEIDNYSPGFTVGVLGSLRLNKYLSLRLSPTIHFGRKHAVYHEQKSGADSTQVFKSTYISMHSTLSLLHHDTTTSALILLEASIPWWTSLHANTMLCA